ncbi:phosphoglycolate phosphatase [Paenibacillus hunanensis]|uniref:Hydrolase of the HAD superfamily n=1 Tax=Paenibacillus hunanensis TaxID=539262 RepID=A0ABU1J6D3_9BACL|nr:putative hydrolase of the HAD superfamily [Paenibacillus hunanensis]GGJ04063.1 phosphoglycolate phosphatase [Paenibacillus hunanensis]
MIKAVVFDFDGLILDTETVWFECYKKVLARYRLELTLEQFAPSIGTHNDDFRNYIERELKEPGIGRTIEQEVSAMIPGRVDMLQARAGVQSYLEEAKGLGLRIALATSSDRKWIEYYLQRLELRDYFEVIKTSDDVSAVKPDPELYLRVIDELRIPAHEAVAFEDSLNGLRAAKGAGLHCTIVPNPVTSFLPFEHYDLRLASMEEMSLLDVLTRLQFQA